MRNQIASAAASASGRFLHPTLATSRFVQKFASAAAVRARFPLPPVGSVGDPYLLDRLQAPLRRYRD